MKNRIFLQCFLLIVTLDNLIAQSSPVVLFIKSGSRINFSVSKILDKAMIDSTGSGVSFRIIDSLWTIDSLLVIKLKESGKNVLLRQDEKGFHVTFVPFDSTKEKQDTTGRIIITVNPKEASNALITIIRKSKLSIHEWGNSEYQITPDTLGTWNAPLLSCLALGQYDFKITKEGFKDILQSEIISKNEKDSILVEMYSLEYIKHKQEQWGTVKWINAGIATAAGIASYFIHARIETLKDEYNNAISSSVIEEKRRNIAKFQNYYKISSAVSFTFIGGFGVSWIIQNGY